MKNTTLYIITQHFYPSEGATAQLISDIAQALSSDFKTVVLTSTPGPSSNRSDLTIVRFSSSSTSEVRITDKLFGGLLFTAKTFYYLHKRAVPSNSHLLIASNPPFIGLIGSVLYQLSGISYTFLFQDLFPRSAVLAGILPSRGPINTALRLLLRNVIGRSSSTILLSQSMKSRAIREYGFEQKYHIIPNWAVESAVSVQRSSNPLAISWNITEQFVVFYSGNFGRLHDLLTILEAARLCIENTNILFLFVGGGAQFNLIKNYCDTFSLSNVMIRPYVSRELLPFSLQLADLSIVSLKPGSDDTVSPSKIYGPLSSGKPVLLISSPATQLSKEMIQENFGFHIETGDSPTLADLLHELSNDHQPLAELGNNAHSYYHRNLGRDKSIQMYRDLLLPTNSNNYS